MSQHKHKIYSKCSINEVNPIGLKYKILKFLKYQNVVGHRAIFYLKLVYAIIMYHSEIYSNYTTKLNCKTTLKIHTYSYFHDMYYLTQEHKLNRASGHIR